MIVLPGVPQGVCHRDLKLENTLLDGRAAPRLKTCDFGYSKVCCCALSPLSRKHRAFKQHGSPKNWSADQCMVVQHSAFDSQPKSIVGTRAYIAPGAFLKVGYRM